MNFHYRERIFVANRLAQVALRSHEGRLSYSGFSYCLFSTWTDFSIFLLLYCIYKSIYSNQQFSTYTAENIPYRPKVINTYTRDSASHSSPYMPFTLLQSRAGTSFKRASIHIIPWQTDLFLCPVASILHYLAVLPPYPQWPPIHPGELGTSEQETLSQRDQSCPTHSPDQHQW